MPEVQVYKRVERFEVEEISDHEPDAKTITANRFDVMMTVFVETSVRTQRDHSENIERFDLVVQLGMQAYVIMDG